MAKKSYTVGQVNGYIKNLISSDYLLGDIYVKGEVSNCKYHSSGHIYFSLKDETGSIMAVMFKSYAYSGLDFKLENGQQVVCHGSVNIYERDGRYQLYVKEIKLDGIGNLYERYEQLKQKLYEQGLFEFDIKKPIPVYPKRVGIVTAQTGAAIQDIRNIAKRRNPYVQLILYPAKVQGDGAAEDIAHGIEVLDNMGVDTIIIGRGGGSIEDLWAFNDERVARAIYESELPVISAVGHEPDVTISDYVADVRASTPSNAAEIAVPDEAEIREYLMNMNIRQTQAMQKSLSRMNTRLDDIRNRRVLLDPMAYVDTKRTELDYVRGKLIAAAEKTNAANRHKFVALAASLDAMSPLKVLGRGYAIASSESGELIKSVGDVNKGDKLSLSVSDGLIKCTVDESEAKSHG